MTASCMKSAVLQDHLDDLGRMGPYKYPSIYTLLYLHLCARNASHPGVTCSIQIGPFQTMVTMSLNVTGLDCKLL